MNISPPLEGLGVGSLECRKNPPPTPPKRGDLFLQEVESGLCENHSGYS
jgi:hypothetical protein